MTEVKVPENYGTGSFMSYIKMPEVTPAPAVIVIQEIFGVNQEMRQKCDALAARGFIALCPDLFWRIEPGVQLTDKTEKEWEKAFDFYTRFNIDKGVDDLRAAHKYLREHPDCNGKVGCIGYCLGGKLAYLMSARTNIDAAVGYYGVGIDEALEEAINIKNPLLLHIAEEDKFVSARQQNEIKNALNEIKLVTIYSYPEADHAFARNGGEHYDDQAANLANARSLDFLSNALSPALIA